MSNAKASNANGAGAGRWVLGIVALMCAGAYGGVAWQKGTLDPMVLLLGPTHSDPETKHPSKAVAKKVEPELSEELVAAQYEPDEDLVSDQEELTTESELEMSVSDEEGPSDSDIQPAGYEIDADAEEAEATTPAEIPSARTAARLRETDTSRDTGAAKKKLRQATSRE